MGLTVTNLIAGPADLYVASFGAVEPTDAAINTVPASAVWTDVGGTNDGVKASIDQNYMKLEADQSVDVLGSRLTGREVIVETAIAEPTLANLVILLNGGTITASAAFQTYDPVNGDTAASQPTYRALLFDGWAPGATPPVPTAVVRSNSQSNTMPVTAVVTFGICRMEQTRTRRAASALNRSQCTVLAPAT